MQEEGLKARPRKRFKCTTMSDHDQPVAANLLDRQFTAAAPNQRWVGDTTEFVIGESGKLYLAAILDLFSRFVVGWAVSAVNDRHLTLKALEMALKRRCPEAGLLHHSDQGCTYASEDYQRMLDAHGITCSMSRRGDCYDNAVMEAFFSTREERARPIASTAAARPRWSCSTTSRCSITSGAGIRRSARSVRPNSKDARHGVWIRWKTAKNAVSHRPHTHHLFLRACNKTLTGCELLGRRFGAGWRFARMAVLAWLADGEPKKTRR